MVMRIPLEVLLTGDQSPQFLTYKLELEKTLRSGRDAAIMPDPEVRVDPVLAQQLTAALASMVQPIAAIVGALVVTGGETARAVFEAWGVNRLRLIGEVEPGLPYSVTSGWSRELPVLTKAGAFGNPETLLNCLHFLHKLDSATPVHTSHINSTPLT
jgi:4-hydroxythreonine-4-phosphate dehydrogenase